MTNTFLQHDSFQRPASYWLRRAERCHQSGDLLRAAVLERHALRADQSSEAASVSYVLTLRQLSCYEASNREAFAALAKNPDNKTLFGLIGQNLLSMGLRDAGLDALNIYLAQPLPDFPPSWHDDACDLYDLTFEAADSTPRRRKARHDGLLELAARHMAKGDVDGAKRALERCSRAPYQGKSAKRELLWSVFHLQNGSPECIDHLKNAVLIRPNSAQVRAAAAAALWKMGLKKPAFTQLLTAARLAASPADMIAVLVNADEMNAPHIACVMLRRMLRRMPNRCPVLYNLCVCMLRLGRLEEASRFIHHCREIDPDDVPSEGLFSLVRSMQEQALSPQQVRDAAKQVSWYGIFSQAELNAVAAPIMEAIEDGPEAFFSRLCVDLRLRRHFLQLLALPMEWPARLLYAAGEALPADECEALMREVLLQHPSPSAAKLCAVSTLCALGVPPPYAAWQNGRIAWLDPTRDPGESAPFRPRLLTLRIRRAQKLCPGDRHIALWCMEIVHRMTKRQRSRVIADPTHVWPLAFAIRYRTLRGMEPLHLDISRLGRVRRQALNEALSVLRTLTK